MRVAATFFDGETWREGVLESLPRSASHPEPGSPAHAEPGSPAHPEPVEGRLRLRAEHPAPGLPRLDGVVTGGFTDAHVHLQLVDAARLADSVLGRVVDLGGDPTAFADALRFDSSLRSSLNERGEGPSNDREAGLPNERGEGPSNDRAEGIPPIRSLSERSESKRGSIEVAFAGAFLTPPGGYPSDRAWAPEGSVREIADAEAAASAVAEMKAAGSTRIKVASNSDAGPVFSDALLRTIVAIAASHHLPVVAHAEGQGEAQRAARLGVRALAHAPFTERLTDDEIAEQAASVTWISTLAIHAPDAFAIAVDNVRRFRAEGGTVRYGTDMGNGPTPVGLHPGEVAALREAGADGAGLLRALAPQDPLAAASRLLLLPGTSPETADPLLARPLDPADLEDLR